MLLGIDVGKADGNKLGCILGNKLGVIDGFVLGDNRDDEDGKYDGLKCWRVGEGIDERLVGILLGKNEG